MRASLAYDGEIAQRNSAVAVIDELAPRLGTGVLTSRDPEVVKTREAMTDLIPAEFHGVTRRFGPIAPRMPSDGRGRFSAYTSALLPGAVVADRTPSAANFALKVVIAGAIAYDGRLLTAGDWLWIPAGCGYAFAGLELGAVVFTALPCVDEPAAGDGGSSLAELADGGVTHSPPPFAPRMPIGTLPVLDGRFFAWLSLLEPGVAIPRHMHPLEQIADIKVVITGSIHCDDRELTTGDWLWTPSGGSYTFTAGDKGALLLGGRPHN